MLRMPDNEFERRLLWRVAIKKSGVTLTKIGPAKIEPATIESATIEPPTVASSATRLPMTGPLPVETSLETRLEQAAPIKKELDAARTSRWSRAWRGARIWQGWRKSDFRRMYSAGRLLFQVVGVAGYAGYFVSMHTLMRVFSGALMAGAWYAIYRIKAAGQP